MNGYTERDCPSCNTASSSARLVARSTPPAEELEFTQLREYWRGFKKDSIFFSYYRCPGCRLLYSPIYFSKDQLSSLYSHMGDNSMGEDLEVLKSMQISYFSTLENRVNIFGHWIEIGADVGLFAALLAARREVSSLTIIEPNQNSHKRLKLLVKGDGVLESSWAEINQVVRFDGLVGVHVLDHLVDLKSELRTIHNFLRIGGSVFFVTHDESSLLRRLMLSKWPPFCLQHPQIFSQQSIANTLRIAGFRAVRTQKSSNFFNLRHIFLVVFSLFGLKTVSLKLVPKLTLKIRLGNFMTLAFRS